MSLGYGRERERRGRQTEKADLEGKIVIKQQQTGRRNTPAGELDKAGGSLVSTKERLGGRNLSGRKANKRSESETQTLKKTKKPLSGHLDESRRETRGKKMG